MLVLKNKTSGQFYEKQFEADLRNCKPDGKQEIDETIALTGIPAGKYDVYLEIADQAENLMSRQNTR